MPRQLLQPSARVLESLSSAVEDNHRGAEEARVRAAEQERQLKIAQQIERAGQILTAATTELWPTGEGHLWTRQTTWKTVRESVDPGGLAVEAQLEGLYQLSRPRFWKPVLEELINVKLLTRPYNPSLGVRARDTDYPVLFDNMENRIICSYDNDGVGAPGMTAGDVDALPGTDEWNIVDTLLERFEN